MKVTNKGKHDIDFDNGLWINGEGVTDCCAYNYLDVEQFEGAEFPDMTLEELKEAINVKEDGFFLKDIDQIPKWAQARSSQNGYYSDVTMLSIGDNKTYIDLGELYGELE